MSQLQLNSLLLDALISTDHIQHAALVRRKDFSLRASTPGFVPRSLEISHIANGFKDSQTLRSTGFTFQERRYKCIRADASAVYGKDGKRGIIAVATPNLIVIGTYDSHMYPSVAAEAIEKLGKRTLEKEYRMVNAQGESVLLRTSVYHITIAEYLKDRNR